MEKRPIQLSIYLFLSALAGGLAWFNLAEYYTIGIRKETASYPFGGEGPVPYYYQSPELYAQVSLVWGCAFSGLFLIALILAWKGNKQSRNWLMAILLLILLAFVLQGQDSG